MHCLHCDEDIPFTGNPHTSIAEHVDAKHSDDGLTHAWLPDRDYTLTLPPATSELDDPALTTTASIRGKANAEPEFVEDYMIIELSDGMASEPPETPGNPQVFTMLLAWGDASVKRSGRQLRHATWYVTRSRDVLIQRAHPEHCAYCLVATEHALARMAEKPGTVIAVGTFSLA